MYTYRRNYQQPPDTEGLAHVHMSNASSTLDYDRIREKMDAAEEHILSRTKKMLARALVQDHK